jgi:hypothetical protein
MEIIDNISWKRPIVEELKDGNKAIDVLVELEEWINSELSASPFVDYSEFKILIRIRNKIEELKK